MNGLGQHQHTHHSGSWSLRLVPPFTWTEGVSPGSPASLCPCPSTVMAVRGVTPGLGLLRRLCRHTGHRRGPAPGDPAVTQIGEATWVGCSVRHLSPLAGVGRDCWGGASKVSPGPMSPSTLSRSTASTIAAVAPTPDPMAGVRAVSLSPITSCADPPGSRWLRPFGPFPDMLLSPVSFEITAHHWTEVSRRTQLPDELLTSKSWFILLICATTAHLQGVDVDFAEAIAILVAGVFASTMTDGLVAVAETRKSGLDAILVSIDVRAFGDGLLDDRVDGCLLDIGQHPDHHLAAALDHAEDRRLFLLQGAAPAAALQSVAPAFASLGPHRLGIALVPG